MRFSKKLEGALYGVAIGDAMGAPVEGWPPGRVLKEFAHHDFTTFIPPTHGGDRERGKGAGRVTDDTLMTEVLVETYVEARHHLDAYDYCERILPGVKDCKRWIPEWQSLGVLWDRLWFPEKYPWMRLVPANADPRTAGVGNRVNCGVAMWMMPVGAVNAGCPRSAYQEAVLLGSAHNESFAVEAGAVMAAAAAEALSASGALETVLNAAVALAKDGTRRAICAAIEAASRADSVAAFVERARDAVAPYDQRTGHVSDDAPLKAEPFSDVGRPSRICSIEELPVALAALSFGRGDALKTLQAAVFYGRDCDSIASMAMAIFGGLYDVDALPKTLCAGVDAANRRDFSSLSMRFHDAIQDILATDSKEFENRRHSMDAERSPAGDVLQAAPEE